MSTPLLIGMFLALVGPLLMNFGSRLARVESFQPWSRVVLWLLAAFAILLPAATLPEWQRVLGLQVFGSFELMAALLAALCILASWPLIQFLQRSVGSTEMTSNDSFKRLAAFSFPYRLFLVVTAAVTEEVLYRGYGVGIGHLLLQSWAPAVAISLVFFAAAHFRWGLGHLLSVFFAGGILSALYVSTESLVACIFAHALVDAAGLLLAPALLARRKGLAATEQ